LPQTLCQAVKKRGVDCNEHCTYGLRWLPMDLPWVSQKQEEARISSKSPAVAAAGSRTILVYCACAVFFHNCVKFVRNIFQSRGGGGIGPWKDDNWLNPNILTA
jgi:hypothetical protein